MDVATLSQNQTGAAERGRSVVFAEPQLFTQLLDQHLAAQQNTANNTDPGARAEVEDADDDVSQHEEDEYDDPSATNHSLHPDQHVVDAIGNAFEPSVADLAQGQASLRPLQGQASLRPLNEQPHRYAANQLAGSGTHQTDQPNLHVGRRPLHTQPGTVDSQTWSTLHDGRTPAQSRQNLPPGALVSAETNPELRSQIPATVSANATFVQEQGGNETSLRAGRDEALARHNSHSGELQLRPDQPKPTGPGTTHLEPSVPVDRPSSGQAAPMLQAGAVGSSPIMAAAPIVGHQPAVTAFAPVDPTGQDISFERSLAPHLNAAGAKAKSGPASPATAARAAAPPARQVAMQIRQAVGAGADHIRIQLQPAELGKVDVHMTIVKQTVHAVVTVDRPEALEQLQRDSRELLHALEEAGLRTDSDSLRFQHREPGGHGLGHNEAGNDPAHADSTGEHADTVAEEHGRQAPRHDGLISIET